VNFENYRNSINQLFFDWGSGMLFLMVFLLCLLLASLLADFATGNYSNSFDSLSRLTGALTSMLIMFVFLPVLFGKISWLMVKDGVRK